MPELLKSYRAAQTALAHKKISAVELTQEALRRAKQVKNDLNAYIHIDEHRAIDLAQKADQKRFELGEASMQQYPLLGIPLGLKDNINWEGQETSAASKILRSYVASYSATFLHRLLEAGVVVIGKTNMDEFAMGSSNENSAYGLVRNPWNSDCVPGGSSGGSAVAVAAESCLIAIGTDTGGSIRQPASFCGLTGLKPTYGTVSRYGIVAFASSLDQAGPMTKDVLLNALAYQKMCGWDVHDQTTARFAVPNFYADLLHHEKLLKDNHHKTPQGLTIGLPKEYFVAGLDAEISRKIDECKKVLEKLGHRFVEVSLPHTQYAVGTYYLCATSEASSNLARYDGIRYGYRTREYADNLELYQKSRGEGFGPEVKRRIMLGTFALSTGYYDAYYRQAGKVRSKIAHDFDQAFSQVDLILTPTTPRPAFKIGSKTKDPLEMYLEDIFTISANLAGIPALSLPCGFDSKGLPLGFQLMGPLFSEAKLFQLGHEYQCQTDHHLKSPSYIENYAQRSSRVGV